MKKVNGWHVPDADSYFTEAVLSPQGFEVDHLAAALKHVDQWKTAVDVGAHIGTWSVAMADRFMEVYAFEPALDTFACLVANTLHFPNVRTYCSALGAASGLCSMKESESRKGNTGSRYVTDGNDCEIHPLDSFYLYHVGFIKIDAEGYEAMVLEGARETIQRDRPVILIEEKKFKDRNGRANVPYDAARKLVEAWGMQEVERVNKDVIFAFPKI